MPRGVIGPLEAFDHASAVRPDAYRITTASLGGRPVRTSSRLLITPDADLRDLAEPPHTLVVPDGPGARRRDPELVAWLREHAREASRLASVCTGAFLLAEAGAGGC